MNINKCVVAGRLGKDPELKALPSGTSVVSFSVAVGSQYKDRDGKIQETTEWFNVVMFGKVAETVAKFFRKGKEIYLEGRMQTRSWDKDGVKQYRTELVANTFQFVGFDSDGDKSAKSPRKSDDADEESAGLEYPEEEINPEDIPF